MKKVRIRALSVTALLSLVGLSWVASTALRLQRGPSRILMGSMILLGLGAAFLVYRLLSRGAAKGKKKGQKGSTTASSVRDLDQLWSKARKRLSASNIAGSKIATRPMVLLLGPERSTKTTLVEQSGLNAEHLAGEVYRDGTVAPTERINVWYGPDGTVFLEVATPVLEDSAGWRRVARYAKPRSLKAVFGRGRQPSRAVVVCYPCDELADSARTETRVRDLRERLLELSEQLGIRLPVYVVFTKMDKIPYFQEYVRNLQPEEAHQTLGATLPLSDTSASVDYEQVESGRVLSTFDALLASLASRRVDLLRREGDEAKRQNVYEFPREVAKLRGTVSAFLLDLCRPSPLAASPFLRGYYFSGVRPVEVIDAAEAAAPAELGSPSATDASRIFDPREHRAAVAAPAGAGASRRVPEWVFVRQLFARVLCGDEAAREVTGGGAQVNLLRRGAAVSVAALLILFIAGMSTSFLRNRALAKDVGAAIENVASLAAFQGPDASAADLARADALRQELERIRTYRADGPGLSMRWGLYGGDRIFPDASRAYFAVFDRLLGRETKSRLIEYLEALPDRPLEGADPAESYNALRAYVQLTAAPDSSADGDLAGTLTRFWGGASDSAHRALAERQFAFLASELPLRDPDDLNDPPDADLIAGAQQYYSGFNDEEHLYRSLLAEAAQGRGDTRFTAPGAVSASAVVAGAFTAAGWAYVQDRLASLDLGGKPYVVGQATMSNRQAQEWAARFRERYADDYVVSWSAFLAAANVSNFSLSNAADRLDGLRSGSSPLAELFALITRHTYLDSGRVRSAFQPVHHVMPFDTAGGSQQQLPANYFASLNSLWGSLAEYGRAGDDAERQSILEQAAGQADQVLTAAADIARGFDQAGEAASSGRDVSRLLRNPAERIQSLSGGFINTAQLAGPNGTGARFCADVGPIFGRYPFVPSARSEVTVDDLDVLFHPSDGLLGALEADLSAVVRRTGAGYRAASPDGPQPTSDFLAFLDRATRIQSQLYGSGEAPVVDFTLRVDVSGRTDRVLVNIGGSQNEITTNRTRTMQFRWDPARPQNASISVTIEGVERTLAEQGAWAVHRLFAQADPTWEDRGGGRWGVQWTVPGAAEPVLGELQLSAGALILDARVFSQLGSCPSPVVR